MHNTIFGTDGIRAEVGTSPLTYVDLPSLGMAISSWAEKKYNKQPNIIMGHDGRISHSLVQAAIKTGLLLFPVKIYDAGLVPTPTIFNALTYDNTFDFGIIISASHNPYYDNGIKIACAKTGKLTVKDETEISQLFFTQKKKHSYTSLGTDQPHDIKKSYIKKVVSLYEQNFLRNIKIVLDCAHGATSEIAPKLFEQLGAKTIVINNKPNGTNINKQCGSTDPSNLVNAVLTNHADIGFAFDGDGDRIIAVNKCGHIKDGDDILCLLADHTNYKQSIDIVGTIMTNQGLETYLQSKRKKLLRSKVGDKHVVVQLKKHNLLLGGEPSGHIIMRDYMHSGDGMFTALRILETIQQTDNWHMTTFEKYPQVMINVPVKEKKDLNSPELVRIIQHSKKTLQQGRLIVRYSGTENILRVMVEEEDYKLAHTICSNLSKNLEHLL